MSRRLACVKHIDSSLALPHHKQAEVRRKWEGPSPRPPIRIRTDLLVSLSLEESTFEGLGEAFRKMELTYHRLTAFGPYRRSESYGESPGTQDRRLARLRSKFHASSTERRLPTIRHPTTSYKSFLTYANSVLRANCITRGLTIMPRLGHPSC